MGKCKENFHNVRMLQLNVLVYMECKSYILYRYYISLTNRGTKIFGFLITKKKIGKIASRTNLTKKIVMFFNIYNVSVSC